ncbi:MAG: leucine-rich repeat domain-containing protein [Flavobacteriales bacterium]
MVGRLIHSLLITACIGLQLPCDGQLLSLKDLDTAKVYTSIQSALVHPESVFRLDLSKQKWMGLPDELFQLGNLQELRLNKCRISHLPDRFSELPLLQHLQCEHNEIDTIPLSITQLTHLRVLNLADNLIERIPDEIDRLGNLETLALWDNPITYYPERLTEMPQLRVFDVLNNAMSRDTQERLKNGLPNCKIIMSPPCACMDGED